MPSAAIVIIVLVAWGVGATVGSASSYLSGAVLGVVVTSTLLALLGGIVAWRHPSRVSRSVPFGRRRRNPSTRRDRLVVQRVGFARSPAG